MKSNSEGIKRQAWPILHKTTCLGFVRQTQIILWPLEERALLIFMEEYIVVSLLPHDSP